MSAGRCDDRSYPLIGNDGDLDLALLGLRTCLHVTNEGVGSEQLPNALGLDVSGDTVSTPKR
jgi:hypothetical protein